eukprot:751832-Hanusia_phi.AAC.2
MTSARSTSCSWSPARSPAAGRSERRPCQLSGCWTPAGGQLGSWEGERRVRRASSPSSQPSRSRAERHSPHGSR